MGDGILHSSRGTLFGDREVRRTSETTREEEIQEKYPEADKIADMILTDIEERFGVRFGDIDLTERDYVKKVYIKIITQKLR